MKSIVRKVIFYSVALFLTSQLVSGLQIAGGIWTYVIGGVVLALLFMILKPILSIITLPLNVITLGLFSFIINAIILYLLTVLVVKISISAFTFEGINWAGFIVPSMFINGFFAFIVVSVFLSVIVGGLRWLSEK